MAFGECSLGLERILESADSDHGKVDRLADRRGDEHRVARRDVHRRFDHEQACRGHTDRRVDVVDLAGLLDEFGDANGVVDRGAAVNELVPADSDAERKSIADHLADCCDDLNQQARPVLERAAVAVCPFVGRRRQKPADDGAVRALQFNTVEAAFGAVFSDQRIPGDDFVDLGVGDGFRHFAEKWIGNRGGSPDRQSRVHR